MIRVGPVILDQKLRKVREAATKRPIPLTGAEYLVFEALIERAGAVVDRTSLCRRALRREWWGVEDRSVDQIVGSLRQKLPRDVDGDHLIRSMRSQGYIILLEVVAGKELICQES